MSLTVNSGLSVPESGALKIDSTTTVQQMQGTIPISIAVGTAATEWIATSDQPWLVIQSARGAFGVQPTWRIDPAAFNSFANNQHYKARVRITTNSSLEARTFTLDAHKALASIKGLDSMALIAGQSGDVLLYGSGFDALGSGVGALKVTGVEPVAVTRLNDKVLQVTLPTMAAGSYQVSLNAASGMATAAKPIHITTRNTYSYQTLDTEGRKGPMVWDGLSKSVFVVNKTLKSVMRYAPVAGQFQLIATRSFPFVDSIAMTPDRSALVLQAGNSKVYKLSPADLSTLSVIDLAPNSAGRETSLNVPLPIMGDNRLFSSYGWVDLDTGSISPVLYAAQGHRFGSAEWGAVSGNGMRMVWPDSGRTSPSAPMLYTDLLSGTFKDYGVMTTTFFYQYAVNRAGTKWALNNQVVDFAMNILGKYTMPANWLSNQGVFSRNGARLYHYAQSDARGVKPRIYVFDTSNALTTTVNFPVLGYIEFDDLPNCPYDSNKGYDSGCFTFNSHLTISDDDQTIFIAGDKKFTVVPIPALMLSPAPLRQGEATVHARGLIKPAAN